MKRDRRTEAICTRHDNASEDSDVSGRPWYRSKNNCTDKEDIWTLGHKDKDVRTTAGIKGQKHPSVQIEHSTCNVEKSRKAVLQEVGI